MSKKVVYETPSKSLVILACSQECSKWSKTNVAAAKKRRRGAKRSRGKSDKGKDGWNFISKLNPLPFVYNYCGFKEKSGKSSDDGGQVVINIENQSPANDETSKPDLDQASVKDAKKKKAKRGDDRAWAEEATGEDNSSEYYRELRRRRKPNKSTEPSLSSDSSESEEDSMSEIEVRQVQHRHAHPERRSSSEESITKKVSRLQWLWQKLWRKRRKRKSFNR